MLALSKKIKNVLWCCYYIIITAITIMFMLNVLYHNIVILELQWIKINRKFRKRFGKKPQNSWNKICGWLSKLFYKYLRLNSRLNRSKTRYECRFYGEKNTPMGWISTKNHHVGMKRSEELVKKTNIELAIPIVTIFYFIQ